MALFQAEGAGHWPQRGPAAAEKCWTRSQADSPIAFRVFQVRFHISELPKSQVQVCFCYLLVGRGVAEGKSQDSVYMKSNIQPHKRCFSSAEARLVASTSSFNIISSWRLGKSSGSKDDLSMFRESLRYGPIQGVPRR